MDTPTGTSANLLALAMSTANKSRQMILSLLKVWNGPLSNFDKDRNLLTSAAYSLETSVRYAQDYASSADYDNQSLEDAYIIFQALYSYNSRQPSKDQQTVNQKILLKDLGGGDYNTLPMLIASGDLKGIQNAIINGEGLPEKPLITITFLADSPEVLALLQGLKQLDTSPFVTLANTLLYDSKTIFSKLVATHLIQSDIQALYIWSLDSLALEPFPAGQDPVKFVDNIRAQLRKADDNTKAHIVLGDLLDLAVTLNSKTIIDLLIESGNTGDHFFARNGNGGTFVLTTTLGAAMLANHEELAIELLKKGLAHETNAITGKESMAIFPLFEQNFDLPLKDAAVSLKLNKLAAMLN